MTQHVLSLSFFCEELLESVSFHLNCKLSNCSVRDRSHSIPTTSGHCQSTLELRQQSERWKTDYSVRLLCSLPVKSTTAARGPALVDAKVHGLVVMLSVPSGKKPDKLINTNTECPLPVGIQHSVTTHK